MPALLLNEPKEWTNEKKRNVHYSTVFLHTNNRTFICLYCTKQTRRTKERSQHLLSVFPTFRVVASVIELLEGYSTSQPVVCLTTTVYSVEH